MDMMNLSNIPIINNQITTGAPQEGFRRAPGLTLLSPGTDISGISTIKSYDFSFRQGYREDYSVWDAADSLWRQETQTFNLNDMGDREKMTKFLENARIQARWDLGIPCDGPTKEEVIADYIQNLRQNGLDGSVNWSGLSREFSGFKSTTAEELEDGLNYIASRYVAVLDKLERNYTGDELAAQRAKLEETYQAGKDGLIDGYTELLQENLGVSDQDAQEIRDSFSAILSEKVDAYRGALGKVHDAVAQTGPDSVWLKDHDAYIASQLRAAGTAVQSRAKYSVQDLTAAGQIAGDYRAELSGASSYSRNEATLALNLSLADMKAEAMIQKGLVSENMADLLRSSRAQGHQNILDALDKALAYRESTRLPGNPAGSFAPVDRSVFDGIYRSVMSAFQENGDAAGAIRAGVTAGQGLTAQAAARAPKASRWGVSIDYYWKEFYKTPEPEETTRLGAQINRLLIESGQDLKPKCSTYQKYVNQWQDFLASIGGGMDVRA